MEEVKLAYIAGIIDGEGSIMIQRQASKSFMEQRAKSGCFHPHYSPGVRVGMLQREPLDFIVNTTKIGFVHEEKPYHHKRPMYRWMIRTKKEIEEFLPLVMPFLLVKKEQAELCLRFMREWVSCNGVRITPEIQAEREKAWLSMRKLNGVITLPATTEPRGRGGRDLSAPFEATV
jgi:hypothetical protein